MDGWVVREVGLWMGYWCFDDFPLICDSVMINVLDQGTSNFGVGLGYSYSCCLFNSRCCHLMSRCLLYGDLVRMPANFRAFGLFPNPSWDGKRSTK